MKEWTGPLKHDDPNCKKVKGGGVGYPMPKNADSVPPKKGKK